MAKRKLLPVPGIEVVIILYSVSEVTELFQRAICMYGPIG